MKRTEELASDSLRSSVSSPGMPKTYLTPSASRHSTKTSDALRSFDMAREAITATPSVRGSSMPVIRRALGILLALVLACALAGPALGASRFYIRGAGYGHGVGMSQYGAYGYALHGKDWRYILQHYYTGTQISSTSPGQVVRVLLRSDNRISFSGATRAGTRALQAQKRYSVTRRDSSSVVLRSPSGRKLKTFPSPLRVTGPAPLTLYGTAANGVRDGEYRGALEFRAGLFGGVNAIDAASLEDYVRGVVPSEMPATWPVDALRAQAVAARTYALTSNVGGNGFNQYADTRSQVYRGVVAETPASNAAVTDTSG